MEKQPSPLDSADTKYLANEIIQKSISGENFDSLANQYTMDPSNQGNKGGDLGWFKKGRMVKPFEEAAFQASIGQIVGPVLTRFGYHVIRIRDKRIDKNGDDEILASHILLKIDISTSTLSELKRNATLFSYDALDFGFSEAIKTHNQNIFKAQKLKSDAFTVKGLGNFRPLVRFAFNNELNSISDVFENNQYYAICVLRFNNSSWY